MFLFVQSWEVIKGKGAKYTDFVLSRHLPVMQRVGLNMIGGFHVIVGSGPRISAVALNEDFASIQKALETPDFVTVTEELQSYIYGYSNALLRATKRIPCPSYDMEIGTWRFNQYFKLIQGVEDEYAAFLADEYAPLLAKLGIRLKIEWEIVLGSGLRLLLEGVAESITGIAQAVETDEFRVLRRTLLSKFASQYSSRILAPTGRVEMAFMLGEITKSL
ncbi:MAG: hypothetical protein A4E62_02026 [Syntrophorhabdus sp. PtaU1.Bin002]|nr:MAG: hypothetical protein A4E62_02026 [Syntrophorhabdus sp. PtaU1.Bin002]